MCLAFVRDSASARLVKSGINRYRSLMSGAGRVACDSYSYRAAVNACITVNNVFRYSFLGRATEPDNQFLRAVPRQSMFIRWLSALLDKNVSSALHFFEFSSFNAYLSDLLKDMRENTLNAAATAIFCLTLTNTVILLWIARPIGVIGWAVRLGCLSLCLAVLGGERKGDWQGYKENSIIMRFIKNTCKNEKYA